MATKPITLPRWATVGGDIIEPTSGEKDTGFVEGESPPAPTQNWLQYWIYQWILWLGSAREVHFTPRPHVATAFALTLDGADAPELAMRSSASGSVTIDITELIPDGETIASINWRGKGNGTVDVTIDVALVPIDGTAVSVIGTAVQNNVTNVNQALTTVAVNDLINTKTHHVQLLITANATGFVVYDIGIVFAA